MVFAITPEDLERFAIPIGIGLAILLILVVPALRKSVGENYKKGKKFRERLTGRDRENEPEEQ